MPQKSRKVPVVYRAAATRFSGAGSGAARADSGAGKAEMAKNRSGLAKILIHQILVLI